MNKYGNKPIKTINYKGVDYNFYECRNEGELIRKRFMVAEIQELYLRHGVSEKFLTTITEYLQTIAMDSNKPVPELRKEVIAIATNLQQRIGMIAEKSMYKKLACVYFTIDEEPDEYMPKYEALKLEIMASDPESEDFFLCEAYKYMNESVLTSTKDILKIFYAIAERIEQLPTIPTSIKS